MFPHLRSVPPPPMGAILPPPSLQLPFGSPQQHSSRSPHAGRFPNNGKRAGNRESCRPNRGFNKFGGRGRQQQQHQQQYRGRGQGRQHKQIINTQVATPQLPNIIKPTCDTCDKAFPDNDKLAEHLALHEVCGLDGCQFSAHPKIVAAHVEMQHRTGLYKQLVIGADPEEIRKWREERKSRFPTKANIERQQQALKEKIARGERISAPRGRFNHRGRGNFNVRPDFNRFNSEKHLNSECSEKKIAEEKRPDCNLTECKLVEVKEKPVIHALPRALASLAGDYASSGSDCDEAPEEVPINHEMSSLEPLPKKLKKEAPPPSPRLRQQQQAVRQQYIAKHRPPTLLQKLLESEIRHERNVILQCVRHIVNNNFFQ